MKKIELTLDKITERDVSHQGNLTRWLNEFIEKYNKLVDYMIRKENGKTKDN